jgi:hypothetical protein
MGFFSRLFGNNTPGNQTPSAKNSGPPSTNSEEHALLLTFPLPGEFPTEAELQTYHKLQDELTEAIESAAAGELDGDEFGGHQCVIYMYGPDADRLFDAVAPVLEKHPFPKGSTALKRYGGPDCGKSEKVNLHWDG